MHGDTGESLSPAVHKLTRSTASGPSDAMLQAMEELWRLTPPGPDNLLAASAFVRLREACRDNYANSGKDGPCFALATALRSLGLPCELRPEVAQLASSVEDAARRLDAAFRAARTRRLHLIPLDKAGDIPAFAFGSARVGRFTPDELRNLVDETRLNRMFPSMRFDADRFSEFHWLVVEEDLELCAEPEARAVPFLFSSLDQDFGRVEPHKGQFASAIENELFFLLLAPWETWSTMPEVDWRGFRTPWAYTADPDIFVHPDRPPSAETLSWEPYGEAFESERPEELPLRDEAKEELAVWDQNRWAIIEHAKQTPLFETPIVHFFVRAFLAEGVDEFLAHVFAIEAALGLQGSGGTHKGLNATDRMRGRVAGLLGGRRDADAYLKIFNIRSAFVHGRTMPAISTNDRVLARSLARQVVEALIRATQSGPIESREHFLNELLDRGVPMIKAVT